MFENENMQPPSQPAPSQPTPAPAMSDVHTMPERFLDTGMSTPGAPGQVPSRGGSKRWIIIGVIVVVLAALGGGAWFYFNRLAKKTNTNTNTNTSPNTNRVNTNLNLNQNLNLNTNVNLNQNLNLNTNVNQNSNTNTNQTIGSPLPSSTDTDNDGLTDVEEIVYGTVTTNNDSDGDTFIDGMRILTNGKIEGEAYLGYCPTKTGAVRLDDATCGIMKTYTSSTYLYALWVPKTWLVQATPPDEKTVVFTPDNVTTGEYFQVSIFDNPTQLSAKTYYQNLNPSVDVSQVKDVTVNGLDGVLSLDESTVFFVKGTRVYAITYNTDNLDKANLKTTFMIVYQSFHLVTSSSTGNSNSNTNGNTNSPPIF